MTLSVRSAIFAKLYALDQPLDLGQGLDEASLLQATEGHVVAEGVLMGTYQR